MTQPPLLWCITRSVQESGSFEHLELLGMYNILEVPCCMHQAIRCTSLSPSKLPAAFKALM